MLHSRSTDFELAALYLALDAQRQSRGLTWSQAMLEMKPVARSTVAGVRTRAVAEGDGVLQMLRWLKRSPESFVPGFEASDIHKLPDVATGRVLRFDSAKLRAAMDSKRKLGRLTWQQVASEIGGANAASLAHLKKGGRMGFPAVMRFTRWLGQPAADFVRITDR